VATLHLHASEAALEATLARALAAAGTRTAVEVGHGLGSVPRLLREAGAESTLHPLAERLLLREAQRRGGASRLHALLAALRTAGISPASLREVAPRLLGAPGADARRLAEALADYEAQLGDRLDHAGGVRAALANIARGPLPSLAEVDLVVVHAAPLDPLERALVEALLASGRTVRCQVPAPVRSGVRGGAAVYEDTLEAAAASALRALEAIGDARLEAARFECGAGPLPTIHAAAAPALEAREIARQVRDRVAAGAAPDEVVVVADDHRRRMEIARALSRYGVPVESPGGAALDSGALRVVLALYRLAEEGIARDRLVDLLGSPYLEGGLLNEGRWISPGRVARTVREVVPAAADLAGHRAALERWAAGAPAPRRAERDAIRAHVLALAEGIAALPATTTVAHHLAALRALLDRLGLFARARGFRRGTPPAPGSAAAAALARDQAGLRALVELLDALPRAAAQAGLEARALPRGELAEVIGGALAEERLPNGGGRGGAVRLCGSSALSAAPILVLSGAEEGALPRSGEDDPLLGEDARRVLHRALGREIFPAAEQGEQRALLAIAAARAQAREVILTWSRADADGRARLAGPLVLHARALGASETRGPLSPVPALADAREPGELIARLGVDELEAPRPGLRAHVAARHGDRLARVERLAAIERERADFFAGDRPPGAHDGSIEDAAVRGALALGPLPGRAERPLSASTLTRYLECPARFFFESVLRLRAPEEQGDDLDDRASGKLAHLALERLFRAWQAGGLFPLSGQPAERAAIVAAIDAAAAAWSERNPRGHELVWRARLAALRPMLEAVWRREVDDPPAPGLTPAHFELSFDGLLLDGDAGEAPVHLGGVIDRLDLGRDAAGAVRAAVFDYKSGRIDQLSPELKEAAFGESSWQLPLYAAAVRAQHQASEVLIAYYSLRERAIRSASAPAWLSVARSGDPPTLGDRLLVHVRAMRAGRFVVEPQPDACARCRMQPACRIVERREDPDEVPA
jgi:RecB family exonuclease